MNRVLLALSFSALFLASCGGNPPEAETSEEVVVVDTISPKLEETAKEIEKSSEQLDQLLNDL